MYQSPSRSKIAVQVLVMVGVAHKFHRRAWMVLCPLGKRDWPVNFLDSGLEDERYVVERFRAKADGAVSSHRRRGSDNIHSTP